MLLHFQYSGSNKFCLDKNYAAWLIIWDRMFGTFQEKKEDEEIVYGLVDQVQSFNPLYLQVCIWLDESIKPRLLQPFCAPLAFRIFNPYS